MWQDLRSRLARIPFDDALEIKIEDHSKLNLIFTCADIGNLIGPLLIPLVSQEILVQLVKRNAELVITAICKLVFTCCNCRYGVLPASSHVEVANF